MTGGGVAATAVNDYDPVTGRLLIHFTFHRGDQTQKSTAIHHVLGSHRLLAVAHR